MARLVERAKVLPTDVAVRTTVLATLPTPRDTLRAELPTPSPARLKGENKRDVKPKPEPLRRDLRAIFLNSKNIFYIMIKEFLIIFTLEPGPGIEEFARMGLQQVYYTNQLDQLQFELIYPHSPLMYLMQFFAVLQHQLYFVP